MYWELELMHKPQVDGCEPPLDSPNLIVDTHRHLGGSIPVDFVYRTIVEYGLTDMASCREEVVSAMCFERGEPTGFHRFLNKFELLDKIPWNRELLELSVQAVCQQLALEHIDYCWMDLSINKYMKHMRHLNMDEHDMIQFIHALFQENYWDRVGLVLSLRYESPRQLQRDYAAVVQDKDTADCLIGIDLVGDEAMFDVEFYSQILPQWRDKGKMVRAHVAESQSAQNALDAIEYLRVSNIAHGLKMVDHPHILQKAIDQGITVDLGITSNYLADVWNREDKHPVIDMLRNGLRVTYGTDDPVQCGTCMQLERAILRHWFKIDEYDVHRMEWTAIENSKLYW